MQRCKWLRSKTTMFIGGLTVFAAGTATAADVIATASTGEVNMWDGQWHFSSTIYGWLPWMYTAVQLPPIAGGGNPTIETQPSRYLKYLEIAGFAQATVQKGDWGLWTDIDYMNLQASPTHTREIGRPRGNLTLPVIRTIDSGLRMAIWTLAPSYTVMNNDIGTLDVMVGLRHTSLECRSPTSLPLRLHRRCAAAGSGRPPIPRTA